MKKNNKVLNSLLATLLISLACTELNSWSLFKKKEPVKPKKEIAKPKDDTNKVIKLIKKHYGKAITATLFASGSAAFACRPSRQLLINQLLKLDEKISKNDESINDILVKKIEERESELMRQSQSTFFIHEKANTSSRLDQKIVNNTIADKTTKAAAKFAELRIQNQNNRELIEAINVIFNSDRLDSTLAKAAIDTVKASGFIKLEDIFLVRAEENRTNSK